MLGIRASGSVLLLLGAVGSAPTAHAQAPTVALLEVSAVDEDVPGSATRQIAATLRSQLQEQLKLLPPSEIASVRAGVEPAPNMAAVTALIAEAKAAILNFQFKPAGVKLATAKSQLGPLLTQLRDYQPLLDTLLYQAVVAMNMRDKKTEGLAFRELARIRPEYRIDPQQFPPNVLQAFDRVRM